jgi:hypothetical protein
VEGLPCLAINVKQMDFSISVGVLAPNQDDLSRGDRKSAASPKRVLKKVKK